MLAGEGVGEFIRDCKREKSVLTVRAGLPRFTGGAVGGQWGAYYDGMGVGMKELAMTGVERTGYCKTCGYDLRVTEVRCPECGRAFAWGDRRSFRRKPLAGAWWKWTRRVGMLIGVLMVMMGGVWGYFYEGWREEQGALAELRAVPSFGNEMYMHLGSPWLMRHLGRAGFVLDRVQEVEVRDVADLRPLTRLKNLRGLSLQGAADLRPLAKLKNLKGLLLHGATVTDLTPVTELKELEYLRLEGTSVTDLGPVAGLIKLQGLEVFGGPQSVTKVKDLSPLAGLTNLGYLNLGQSWVSDLLPLRGLVKLRELDVANTTVSDLTPLRGLANLEKLNLVKTQVKDLSPLAGLRKLEILQMHGTQVEDITPLLGIKSLRHVQLQLPPKVPAAQVEALQRSVPRCSINSEFL